MWNKGWAGRRFTFSSMASAGNRDAAGVEDLRFEKVPESSSSLRVALRNVWAMPLLIQCQEPINYLPHLASWDQDGTTGNPEKKTNNPKTNTLWDKRFSPLAMARLAPKTWISVGGRQDNHQKALSHCRNFSTCRNIFRNSAGQGGSSMGPGLSWKGAEALGAELFSLFVSIYVVLLNVGSRKVSTVYMWMQK